MVAVALISFSAVVMEMGFRVLWNGPIREPVAMQIDSESASLRQRCRCDADGDADTSASPKRLSDADLMQIGKRCITVEKLPLICIV